MFYLASFALGFGNNLKRLIKITFKGYGYPISLVTEVSAWSVKAFTSLDCLTYPKHLKMPSFNVSTYLSLCNMDLCRAVFAYPCDWEAATVRRVQDRMV